MRTSRELALWSTAATSPDPVSRTDLGSRVGDGGAADSAEPNSAFSQALDRIAREASQPSCGNAALTGAIARDFQRTPSARPGPKPRMVRHGDTDRQAA